jgi:hypothetical protein
MNWICHCLTILLTIVILYILLTHLRVTDRDFNSSDYPLSIPDPAEPNFVKNVAFPTSKNEIDSEPSTEKRLFITKFRNGDVVNDFKLVEKVETLGLSKIYHSDDSWSNTMLSTAKYENISALSYTQPPPDEDVSNKFTVIKIQSSPQQHRSSCLLNQSFCLEENIFHGGHGEIWRAHKLNRQGHVNLDSTFILKRMHVKGRDDILYCAKREIYFGRLLSDRQYFARFITYFTTEEDYWLVFHDEG